jgi:hypothetical protein
MNPTGPGGGERPPIRIDYDHLDVADIMAQLKAGIAAHPAAPAAAPVLPSDAVGTQPPGDEPEPPTAGLKGFLKRLFLKLMRPFAPVQKLIALPTHRELMETVRKLHQTNLRLEELMQRIDVEFHRVNREINRAELRNDVVNERLDIATANLQDQINVLPPRIDDVHRTLNGRIDEVHATISDRVDLVHRTTNERVDGAYARIQRSMEFVKLLHNLSHNIVVELSKLKIEEEGIKLKTRVMEKDFEFLGRRERALEKELLK